MSKLQSPSEPLRLKKGIEEEQKVEDLLGLPADERQRQLADSFRNQFSLKLQEQHILRIWNNLEAVTYQRLLESVTLDCRETIEKIVEEKTSKKDKHEKLIDGLRNEHYESAQLVPFFQKNLENMRARPQLRNVYATFVLVRH